MLLTWGLLHLYIPCIGILKEVGYSIRCDENQEYSHLVGLKLEKVGRMDRKPCRMFRSLSCLGASTKNGRHIRPCLTGDARGYSAVVA